MTSESIVEVKKLFKLAEQYIKEIEILGSAVQMPAINELRYVAYHVLKSIDESGNISEAEFIKAKSHCHRAMYEALEAGIMVCLEAIKKFQDEYRWLVVTEVIRDYPQHLARAQEAVAVLKVGRSDRESVEQQVEQYKGEFHALRDIVQLFAASRNDLNALRLRLILKLCGYALTTAIALLGAAALWMRLLTP